MRCELIELAILDGELGRLAPAAARELRLHLAGCARCAALEAVLGRLRQDLSSLRTEAPFEIDLGPRVRQHLPALDPVDRAAVPARQLGWAAFAAAASGLALVAACWPFAPQLGQGARQALELLSSLGEIAAGLARPLAGVAVSLGAALASLLDSMPVLLESVEPFAVPFVVAASVAMAATILFVVGRDLKKGEAT